VVLKYSLFIDKRRYFNLSIANFSNIADSIAFLTVCDYTKNIFCTKEKFMPPLNWAYVRLGEAPSPDGETPTTATISGTREAIEGFAHIIRDDGGSVSPVHDPEKDAKRANSDEIQEAA
jgi:hypothetical protein